jgi:periplasmic protein TonB
LSSSAAELTQTPEEDFEFDVAAPPAEHPAAEIIAITTQDDFLLELGELIGGQAAVHPVESVAMALDYMSAARRAQILAIDTRDLADLPDAVGRAHARAPDIAILLFANAADVETLTDAFRASKVGAVLPIPIDPARTALVLAAALADSVARFSAPPLADALGQPNAAPLLTEPVARSPLYERIPREYRWALAAGLALLLLAIVPWFARRGPERAAPLARGEISVPAVQAPLAQGGVDELLEKARTAMAARRYTEPAGNCALTYYRSAQAADPANAEARDGLARVAAVLVNRFEDDLRQSQLDAASATLANFKSAAPRDARGSAFESRLTAAKARAELARREEQAQQKRAADAAAQSAREELAQKKAREHAAALAAAQAAQHEAEVARARQAEEAAAKAAALSAGAAQNSGAEHSVAPAQLNLTHYVMPHYPPVALARNLSGSVTVGYTVDEKGVTRDVRVLSAEPAGVFDHDALDAVRQWRYAPAKVDNAPVAVPTRTVIRFKPQ